MTIDRGQIDRIYALLQDSDASAARREIEQLRIVPIPSFGQGLLPRLMFAAEVYSKDQQLEIMRSFLDHLTTEFSAEEAQSLSMSPRYDSDITPFFEIHEDFFQVWRTTLDESQLQQGSNGITALVALSGALGTIWRPALYDDWEAKGPSLPVWQHMASALRTVLLAISRKAIPATKAAELDAFAACSLALYQGGDERERTIEHLFKMARGDEDLNASSLWHAALYAPLRRGMNAQLLARSAKEPSRPADQVERPALAAVYPEAVAPGAWYPMDLFLYARRYQDLVDREAEKLGQVQGRDFETVRTYFSNSISEGTKIRIAVYSDDFDVNPGELSVRWLEEYYRFPFRIKLRRSLSLGDEAVMNVDVAANGLPLGNLTVSIGLAVDGVPPKISATYMQWYSEVFASYAHEDIEVVRRFRQEYEALGVTLFVDEYGLRGGVAWEQALIRQIRDSDIFQLFWSVASRESKYVTWEWRNALELIPVKGAAFIRPIFWEEQMPKVPKELSVFHFRRILF